MAYALATHTPILRLPDARKLVIKTDHGIEISVRLAQSDVEHLVLESV